MSETTPREANGGNGRGRHALEYEPLVQMADADEYGDAYRRYKAGEWDAEQWTAFRLRFGIYGQLQPGVQMTRLKLPGGIMSFDQARAIARINDKFAGGPKNIHITTRQDIQLYYVPLDETPDFVRELYAAGVTTREACGNTLRNMNGCQLAGICPRERVDAGKMPGVCLAYLQAQGRSQLLLRKHRMSRSG